MNPPESIERSTVPSRTALPVSKRSTVRQLNGVLLVAGLALAVAVGTTMWVVDSVRIGSPAFERIQVYNQLIADVLPPPQSAVEAMYAFSRLADAPRHERLAIVQQLSTLEANLNQATDRWAQQSDIDESVRVARDRVATSAKQLFITIRTEAIPFILGTAGVQVPMPASISRRVDEGFLRHRQDVQTLASRAETQRSIAVSDADRLSERLFLSHALVSAAAVVALGIAGWLVVCRLGLPLRRLASALRTSSGPLPTAPGEIGELASAMNAMTANLRASEARLKTLVEGSDAVLWEFDWSKGQFTYVSPQAARFGYPLSDWLAPGFWHAHLHPDDREQAIQFCQDETRAGRDHHLQYRMLAPDGSYFWIDDHVSLRTDVEGRRTLFGVMIDATAAKAREQQLADLHQQAVQANRTKSEFLANMSHEIRTPLTAIMGYVDLLREEGDLGKAPPERLQTIDTIRNAGQHLLTIINDILDISKIEAGRMSVEHVATDIAAAIDEVHALLAPRAAEKSVELKCDFTTPLPSLAMSDPTRLRQILLNIVGNACKFTAVGSVHVRTAVISQGDAARLHIEVADTGMGLTPEQASVLFQPFSQADGTMTRRFGGTGLGLTIARRLASLMGGDVRLLRSEAGQGATFLIDLPLRTAPGAVMIDVAQRHAAPVRPGAATNITFSGRILLAEDGPDNQRLIAHYLRRAGATVEIADNGRIALEMVTRAIHAGQPFELIVSDMQMPEMDGFTMVARLRERGDAIPVIALTAHAMPEDRQRCFAAGCNDFATKPIDRTAFLSACARWIAAKPSAARSAA